ncbi:alpha-2,8-sialyltransferase 8F-like [Lytechinus variegatus]|uniref:alpha-2,8-sialyltransferase 8F-like n=1 Tax=Lytechinus variegatus TaxID=7654 RepID=UPI001BB219AA|nr:alpha-2,8-sialyltransferase 8F-like [Lytechinus variegatus]
MTSIEPVPLYRDTIGTMVDHRETLHANCLIIDDEEVKQNTNSTLHDQSPPTNMTNGTISHLLPSNGTLKLWKFNDVENQQLYLYESLLKHNWTVDLKAIQTLRQQLSEYRSELGDRSEIILHQRNTKVKQKIYSVFRKSAIALPRNIFNFFPKTDPLNQETRYRSCAVIGNSGVLLNSSCGNDIDKHDFVFRCNLASLSQFKIDVGMKSSLTTMNPSLVARTYKELKKAEDVRQYNQDISQYDGLLWVPCFNYPGDIYRIPKIFSSFKGKKPKIVCGNPQHFRSVMDFWKERGLTNPLSTGFYLVSTAVQVCDEVHLYGFWPFLERYGDIKSDVMYHYFDNMTLSHVHSMDEEFNILIQLHIRGILRINI